MHSRLYKESIIFWAHRKVSLIKRGYLTTTGISGNKLAISIFIAVFFPSAKMSAPVADCIGVAP